MCYTVGVIVGPALGGWLSSSGDLYAGARVAVLLSMLAFVLSFCMSSSSPVPTATSIPQYESSIRHKSAINQASLSSGQILSKLTSVLRAVWPLLLVKIFISFANSLSDATRPIVLKNEFFFDHTHLGYFMSFSSCVSAVSDGALTGPLVNILGNELSIVQSSCIAILVCLYITQAVLTSALFGALWISMSYYSSLISYVCTYFVILVFRHILSSTVTGLTTGRVQADEKGTLLGLENALYAAARVIGPLVGVQLYTVGRASLVAFGSAIVFGVCYFFWSRLKSMGKPSVPIKTDIISDEEEEDDVLISQQQTSHLRL